MIIIKSIKYFVGIDMASENFTCTVFTSPNQNSITKEKISNNTEGFQDLTRWLKHQKVRKTATVVCIENTGVYNEHLCYFLHLKGYSVALEAPHKVKRAFNELTKNDRVDSKKIAEYAYRYLDQLPLWKPKDHVLEQIKVLYSTREHLTNQLIANKNALTALKRKVVQTSLANKTYEQTIKNLNKSIKALDIEIENLINNNTTLKRLNHIADSVPGVGKQLAGNLMIITDGFTTNIEHRKLSSLIGIAPHEHTSGKTIRRKARSRRHGHRIIRKLLHLAARSVATHNTMFRKYYLRKLAEGKPKKLVYNNIANKLLKIICAVIKSGKAYIENFISVNPIYI